MLQPYIGVVYFIFKQFYMIHICTSSINALCSYSLIYSASCLERPLFCEVTIWCIKIYISITVDLLWEAIRGHLFCEATNLVCAEGMACQDREYCTGSTCHWTVKAVITCNLFLSCTCIVQQNAKHFLKYLTWISCFIFHMLTLISNHFVM